MITIYHNNRCSKSREALDILEASGKEFTVVKYLEDVPTKAELTRIIELLDIMPIDLVRKNESVWKENFRDVNLTDEAIIDAMIEYPKLIERPIVVNGERAVIGRPPQDITSII
ncbi:arsenate reductase (glutaredoxin) [Formosa algae]|jgi:arsenate reductase|uniref:Arsenate reductase n=1 Tax=Formosa algae TaxID=225843 RepID=A0A9X0YJP7_9FLAO|nr:arsenate reductase (glutaredoxin) [Formosa algae]MBP1840360.1 arsenate reductase [Formosa algae]MDQ0334224.1 arsenate reductase [Formosa algae]OEI82217.1 arsenate reductase (glutaredoxin) [Formosa algae]PNW29555.1 arsenate reductase (glutaredoxin) [Formosa algae]